MNFMDVLSIFNFDVCFYNNLFTNNDVEAINYMFKNYDNYYKLYTFCYHSMDGKMIRLIIDDVINKKIKISKCDADWLFNKCCQEGDYDYAYILKYNYPKINITRVKCDKKYTKLHNWLQNGCPINCSLTKSARKVV